jgi:hypothetical protein
MSTSLYIKKLEKCFTNVKSLFLPLGGCFITQNAGLLIVLFLPLCPAGIRGFSILVGRGDRGRGGGVYGLYLFIYLVMGWAINRRERSFSLLFFLFVEGGDKMKAQTTRATNTLKNP